MDKFLVSVCYRAICTILVSGIILLDLSYAYPSDRHTSYSALGVPSLNQPRPINNRASGIHLEGAMRASIRDIGDYYFGGSEGARSARANYGEDRAEQRFGKMLRGSGVEILNIVPVEFIMRTASEKLKDALDGIGFRGELPREGVIFVLFKTGDDGRLLAQIARKDEVSSDNLPGYDWDISDKYLVKCLSERGGQSVPTLHHFPLYIWTKLKPATDKALKDGRIAKDTYNSIVSRGLGIARLEDNGGIVIEESVLPIIAEVLNTTLGRAPPNELTIDDIRSYLAYHEEQHLNLRGKPNNIIEGLSTKLKSLPDYNDIKDGFINNYGIEYSDDTAFAEELLVVFITETNRLHQAPRILRTGKKKREDIPLNWIIILTQAYFKTMPSINDKNNLISLFLIPYINDNYKKDLKKGSIKSIDLIGGNNAITITYPNGLIRRISADILKNEGIDITPIFISRPALSTQTPNPSAVIARPVAANTLDPGTFPVIARRPAADEAISGIAPSSAPLTPRPKRPRPAPSIPQPQNIDAYIESFRQEFPDLGENRIDKLLNAKKDETKIIRIDRFRRYYNEYITRLGIATNELPKLRKNLLTTCYHLAFRNAEKSVNITLNAYQDMYGSISLQDITEKEKLQLIIATYKIAMNKGGSGLPNIINTYNTSLGIDNWQGLSQELKLQLIIATYAIAMKKGGAKLSGIINTYNTSLGITDWRELPQEL